MEVSFSGGAYETFSKDLNAQECVNFFTHVDQSGGTASSVLRGTPGLKRWCNTSNTSEVRMLHTFNGLLYAVVGKKVYQISPSGNASALSGSLNTSNGPLSSAHSATELMFVDGSYGYVISETDGDATFSEIGDDAFPESPKTVTQQDGYFLVTLSGSGRLYLSGLNQATSWNDTQYFNAEGNPDNSINAISSHRDIVVFGEKTIEFWYNSGNTVPFDRKPGFTQEIGIGARHSLVKFNNLLYFLTDKKQIAVLTGNNPKIISTKAIDHQIEQYSVYDDAVGMFAEIEGNSFYILTFSDAKVTWCYNVATGMWNQLSSGSTMSSGAWRGSCTERIDGKVIVGDIENGRLYQMDFGTYTDNLQPIVRKRTSMAIRKENKNMFHGELEIMFDSGWGLDGTAQGDDPEVMMTYSDDGGHTWSDEVWRNVGKLGQYANRTVFYRLGSSRHRNYRITVSDPVKWIITGVNLEVELGAS